MTAPTNVITGTISPVACAQVNSSHLRHRRPLPLATDARSARPARMPMTIPWLRQPPTGRKSGFAAMLRKSWIQPSVWLSAKLASGARYGMLHLCCRLFRHWRRRRERAVYGKIAVRDQDCGLMKSACRRFGVQARLRWHGCRRQFRFQACGAFSGGGELAAWAKGLAMSSCAV